MKTPRGTAIVVVLAALLAAAAPASASVVINEVESDGAADFVELMNVGDAPADVGGYVIKDSDDGNSFTVPGGTTIPANGFYAADLTGAFGLSSGDQARLFAPGDLVTPVDSYSWTSHAAATYGRCPDGTGAMGATSSPTPGAANDCPVAAAAWPGGAGVAVADGTNVFGTNLSGLSYQPSGTSAKGTVWAVRNGPSLLYRLKHDGAKWAPDTAGGWSAGKQLFYGNGGGVPDAEGVTQAANQPSSVYVATERDDSVGGTSRPAVLRFDVSSAAASLNATHDWDLTGDLPGLGANAGLEAITWVPDDVLVAKGFFDEAIGAKYAPTTYPDHGAGLFFVGVEQDGRIVAYALNHANGTSTRVASIASGFPKVMALEYEPETKLLWAVCDDSCNGRHATLDVAQNGAGAGKFAVKATYERPGGMANLNNEGFAIAPQAECVSGLKPALWTDDGNTEGHALRTGTLSCTVPPATEEPKVTPTPTPTPAATPTPTATPAPQPAADRTAPALNVSIRSTRALRRTGRLGVTITLGEKADLTFGATARRSARAKARRIVRATRPGVAAGRRTVTFKLSSKARRALRRGERLTLTVAARDAAGNATTRRATAKVR